MARIAGDSSYACLTQTGPLSIHSAQCTLNQARVHEHSHGQDCCVLHALPQTASKDESEPKQSLSQRQQHEAGPQLEQSGDNSHHYSQVMLPLSLSVLFVMLRLSCLFVPLLLSILLLPASAQSSNGTVPSNINFTRITAAAPFPATFTAGSAYLTTSNVTVLRNGINDTFPAQSWLLLAGSTQAAGNGTYNDIWLSSNGAEWQLWNGVELVNGSTAVAGQTNASYWPVAGAASCRDNNGHYFVVAGDYSPINSTAVPSYASYDTAQHFTATHYNTTLAAMSPRAFATCMANSTGTVVVVGGKSLSAGSGGNGTSDVWAFNVDWSEDGVQADDWQRLVNASVVEARYGHASAVAFGQGVECIDVLYVTGGKNSSSSITANTYYNDVYYSVDGGSTWQPRNSTSALWSPRAFHSLTVAQSGILIVAGGQNDTAVFNDVWMSFNGGFDWLLATAAAGFQQRSGHAFLIDANGHPVVIGGSNYYSSISRAIPLAYNDIWTLTTLDLNNLTTTAALLHYNLTTPCIALPGLDCVNACPVAESFGTKIAVAAVVLAVLFACVVGFLLWSRRYGPHKQVDEYVEYEEEVYEEEEEVYEEGEDDVPYTQAPR